MFRSLRVLSDVPQVGTLLPLSLVARLHMSGLPVALPFLLTPWTGSYATAGLMATMLSLGQAIAGPIRGRVADRGSASRLLFTTGVGYAIGLGALIGATVLLPGSMWPVALLITLFTGLMIPPISQISRALWPRIAQGEARKALYTLDATGWELVAVGAPLLVAGIVTIANGAAAVAACLVLAVGGAFFFGVLLHRSGMDQPDATRAPAGDRDSSTKRRSLLRDLVFLRAVLVPLLLMAALFAVNLSMIGWARHRGTPGLSGVMVALLSLGSATGGMVVVGRGVKVNNALTISGATLGMGVLALLLPPLTGGTSVWLLAIVIVATGTMVAPSLAASYSRVGDVAPRGREAEAFGWVATATTCGAGIMLPITGSLIDASGPGTALGSGAAAALVSALLAFSVRKAAAAEESQPREVASESAS